MIKEPNPIYFTALRGLGDVALELLVINAIAEVKNKELYVITNPRTHKFTKQYIDLFKYKIKIVKLAQTKKWKRKTIYDLNPRIRSIKIITQLIKLRLFGKLNSYRLQESGNWNKGIKARILIILTENILSRFILKAKPIKGIVTSEEVTFSFEHIINSIVRIVSKEFHISKENLQQSINCKLSMVREKQSENFKNQSQEPSFTLVLPEVGGVIHKQLREIDIEKIKIKTKLRLKIGTFSGSNYNLNQNFSSIKYNSLKELVNLSFSAKDIIATDSLPAHILALIGRPITVYVPGTEYGAFWPYPKWLKTKITIMSSTEKHCFCCHGVCTYSYRCMQWENIIYSK